MGLLDPGFSGGLLRTLNDPLFGMAIGLLSGGQPGGTFASGLQQGLLNAQGMQRATLASQLTKAQLEEIERQKHEAEARRKAALGMFAPGINPLFPEPVSNMLQSYAQVDPEGAAKVALGAMTQQPGDVKTVDLGDRVGVIDPVSGQIIQTYAKGATPSSGAESTEKLFSRANTLRDEYVAQSKDFVTIRNAYGKIQASAQNPSPAGDLSLIFSYMKILDPTSVVREGEQASARNAAGVPDQIRNIYNRVVSGQQLNPEQRADFVNRAGSLFAENLESQRELENYYSGLSGRTGIDPQNVLVDVYGRYRDFRLETPDDKKSGTIQGRGKIEAQKVVGGKRYMRVDGQWYEE